MPRLQIHAKMVRTSSRLPVHFVPQVNILPVVTYDNIHSHMTRN